MAGLCEGGNEPSGSLKAICKSLPSKETLIGHSDSSFRGEGYIQCCVGIRLCDMYSNQELAEIHFMYGKADGNAALARQFIPQGATVDKILYKEILGRLRNSIRRKRPELWHRKNWLFLHDNAPAHRSILVQEELARQQVAVLPHPPYSPDLAPCDFFLFPLMKSILRGRNFYAAEKVMTATREAIRHLPANIFQQCFQQLHQRWQTCIEANGDYIEEDVDLFKCTPYHAASSETSRFLWVPTLQASVSELNDCTTYVNSNWNKLVVFNCPKTGLGPTSDTIKTSLMATRPGDNGVG
ncbi:hypothetical protein ANN_01786 [Periplaneta americana]|uniref:Mariner Mos1 transposase n=1 Tax=Periplaneta americana TaxID=6978 RepID=A0ABQ8TXI3_PERAM|nr:hypothetical protein ANN_01786 [Periplaneta americana]